MIEEDMTAKTSLKDLERKLYRASLQDGILDIQIGCVMLIFAVAPLLSVYLGDFWSSAVFLPFWALLLVGSRFLRKNYIQPRIGQIAFGPYRTKRLKILTLLLLVFNLVVFGLGLLAYFLFKDFQGWMPFSIIILAGFSLGGYLVETPRFYLYGMLAAAAPMIGEYLYRNYAFIHHGFPVTFGVLAGVQILVGVFLLLQIFHKYPMPDPEDLGW
jgi:hypothetical protein